MELGSLASYESDVKTGEYSAWNKSLTELQ